MSKRYHRSNRPHGQQKRSTPAGSHVPVMLAEVLQILDPKPGEIAVDCTLGWGGHACELLQRVGPTGTLLGMDLDANHLENVREKLEQTGFPFVIQNINFAGVQSVVYEQGFQGVDLLLADLGMSSLQIDEQERGFSYARNGVLDMRMNQTRGKTAAEILATISEEALAEALWEYGDEPNARVIAHAIVTAREITPLQRTSELADLIRKTTGQSNWRLQPRPGKWVIHPAARTFQALRIMVNREMNNLEELLRVLPDLLNPSGRAAIISFHSGEDRRVKIAFRDGLRLGQYSQGSDEPLRPTYEEKGINPRSRSAKLRWVKK